MVIGRLLVTGKLLARDPELPRWLRWLFVFGAAPVPFFFDEIALVIATALMLIFHRQRVVDAWQRAIERR